MSVELIAFQMMTMTMSTPAQVVPPVPCGEAFAVTRSVAVFIPATAAATAAAADPMPVPTEVSADTETTDEFAKYESILGRKTLPCKHCHCAEVPLYRFAGGLEKMFQAGTLTADKVPKTCDKMRTTNATANIYTNPVTNATKGISRWEHKLTEATDDAERAQCRTKIAEFQKIRDAALLRLQTWRTSTATGTATTN